MFHLAVYLSWVAVIITLVLNWCEREELRTRLDRLARVVDDHESVISRLVKAKGIDE